MERVQVKGAELEFDVRGAGEPVLLIHGSIVADAFAPLLAQDTLTDRYRVIQYHRVGFAGSAHPGRPVSIAEQAAHADAILRHLGVRQAHIVGHSYGGAIALQLALDVPNRVHSLTVLEPAGLPVPSAPQLFEGIGAIAQLYAAGDKDGATAGFLQAMLGPEYRTEVPGAPLPAGWYEQAVREIDTFFRWEVPAMQQWSFTQKDAGAIKQPVLSVLGSESDAIWPGFGEGHQLLQQWIPQAEAFVLPNANHGLQMMNPRGLAEGLTGFFARHPLTVPA